MPNTESDWINQSLVQGFAQCILAVSSIEKDEVRRDANHVLKTLELNGCKYPPVISKKENGDVVFYWNIASVILSIYLEGNKHYTYYVKSLTAEEESNDEVEISEIMPSLVVNAFKIMNQGI